MEGNEINMNGRIDELEVILTQNGEPVNCPVKHTFVPGMYIRRIFMPKGKEGCETLITSMVHNTTHPFFVLQGKVSVMSENDGVQLIEAPYEGITTPNTRRVLLIHEDVVWVTVHATDVVPKDSSEEELEKAANLVGEQILAKYENKLLGGFMRNNVLTQSENNIKNAYIQE